MHFWITIGLIVVLSSVGLTYEIAAGRVLAPFFGTSLLTWTAVIATVLAGFSLGNALGGFVAERRRGAAIGHVRAALIATAVLMALSPTILGLIHAAGARGTGGMLLSVVLAFFPGSVFVSVPSPFLAKVAVEARPGREGSSLGLVLAAGSLGAILGAILAGFVALPLAGSRATFAACGAVTLLCIPFIRRSPPRAGGEPEQKRTPEKEAESGVTIAAAALAVFAGLAGTPTCEYESGLSCIHVLSEGGEVRLYADGTLQAAERIVPNPEDGESSAWLALSYSHWLWARMDHDLGPSPSVLFIGGGGYTLPTTLLASRPEAQAVAVEIDPLVTWVVRQHMPQAGAMMEQTGYDAGGDDRGIKGRLGIVHADGRAYLTETDRRFDAAVMDAFSSGSVPAHLATRETYERLQAIVDGPVYVNLIDVPDGPLARGVHAILSSLYPHVQAAQGPVSSWGRANIVLAASDRPLISLDPLPDEYTPTQLSPARPFTDDRGWAGHR